MEITTKKEAKATVVKVIGRMDAVTAPVFEKGLRDLIEGGELVFIIDFSDLDYISSAGLRGLLVIAKQLKGKSGQIRCAGATGAVKEVFAISGFGAIFKMDETVAAALGDV